MRRDRPWQKRLLRIVRALAVAIVSLWALYVVAINLFLSTPLFDRVVNADSRTLWVGYAQGWSVFPGTIHARKLSLRSSDANVEWILHVDRVTFGVSFVDLARKRFTARDVRGEGIAFHLRTRRPAPELTEDVVANVPPIPGFGRLPMRPPEPPGPEVWSDEAWHLWTIRLEEVVAEHVRDVWIDRERFQGDARIAGGFYLKPIRDVWIGPIATDVREGKVAHDAVPIVPEIAGQLGVRVKSFDPRTVKGADLVHHVSVDTDLRLRARLDRPELRGDVDARRIAVVIEDGVVKPASAFDLTLASLEAEKDGRRVRGALDVRSRSTAERLVADVEVHDAELAGVGRVPRAHVEADAPGVDLAKPLEGLHVLVRVPDAEVPDVRALAPLPLLGGSAHLRADFQVWPGEKRATGSATLQGGALAVRVAKVRVDGDTTADLRMRELRWGERTEAHDATLEARVHHATIAPTEGAGGAFVELGGLELSATGPLVDLSDPLRAFSAKLRMLDGEIVDRGMLAAYLPKGKQMQIAAGKARFDMRGDLVIADHRARGTLDASAPRLGLTLGPLALAATLRAHARVHDWVWEHGDLAVDEAAIDVDRIVASRKGASAPAMTVARIALRGSSPRFAFSDPLARADLVATIESGAVQDASAMNAFLPEGADFGFESTDGRFSADVRASVERHVARGRVVAHARRIGAGGKKLHVQGDADLQADIASWDLDRNRLSLTASALAIRSAEGRFGESRRADFVAPSVVLTGRTDAFDLAHPSLEGFDFRLVVEDATLPDARSLNALLVPGDAVGVASGRARANADLVVSSSQRIASGGVIVEAENAAIHVGGVRLTGDFTVTGLLRGFDPDASRVDVGGSRIAARNVRVEGSSAETKGWRGDVSVLGGSVVLGREPIFDANVRFVADDATPILALALKGALPKFLVGLVRAPNLDARARITLAPETIALRNIDAHGGDVGLRGTVVSRGDHQRGALVVAKGPLSAGVAIDDDGASPKLFGLDRWLREQTPSAVHLLSQPLPKDEGASRKAKH